MARENGAHNNKTSIFKDDIDCAMQNFGATSDRVLHYNI
jgi:hypothetical protein